MAGFLVKKAEKQRKEVRYMSQNNENQHQIYGIPRNLKSAGKVAEVIEVTSLLQGVIMALGLFIICLKVLHIPLRYTFLLTGAMVLFSILPYGKNNDTFFKYIYLLAYNFFVRKTYRRYVRHRSSQQKKIVKQRLQREQSQTKQQENEMEGGDFH